MKIKIDENLPVRIALGLISLGHDAQTAQAEGFSGFADGVIWEAAQREERLLITQDLDFSDVRRFAPGTHHGILVIRLHSPSRLKLFERIEELFQNENISGWEGCFIVATDRKVRVRRPPNS